MKSSPTCLLFVLLSYCAFDALAYSGGAGSCDGGKAAVGGSHLSATTITNGTLGDYDLGFQVNDQNIRPKTNMSFYTYFETGVAFKVAVVSGAPTIKGCLIRVETGELATKTNWELLPLENTQDANVCAEVASATGVTHMNSEGKTVCSGTLTVNQAGLVNVDVTVVLGNAGGVSTYAYDRFEFKTEETLPPGTSPPVPALPTINFTSAPVMTPAGAPLAMPTAIMMPAAAPVASSMPAGNSTTESAAPVELISTMPPALSPTLETPTVGTPTSGSDQPSVMATMVSTPAVSDKATSPSTGNMDGSTMMPSKMNGMKDMPTVMPKDASTPVKANVTSPTSSNVTTPTSSNVTTPTSSNVTTPTSSNSSAGSGTFSRMIMALLSTAAIGIMSVAYAAMM